METSPKQHSQKDGKRGRSDDSKNSNVERNPKKRSRTNSPAANRSSKVSPKTPTSQGTRILSSPARSLNEISPHTDKKQATVGKKAAGKSPEESSKRDPAKQKPKTTESSTSAKPELEIKNAGHQQQKPDEDQTYIQSKEKIVGLERKLEEIEREKERCMAEMKLVQEEVRRYEAIKHQKELITLFRSNLKPKEVKIFIELVLALGNQENSTEGIDAKTFSNLLSSIIENMDQF